MSIDGARANDQEFSDLGIGEAACHQAQHLDFTFGQVVQGGGRRSFALRRLSLGVELIQEPFMTVVVRSCSDGSWNSRRPVEAFLLCTL